MDEIKFSDCVGRSVLVYQCSWSVSVTEWEVLQLSPSGKFAKVRFTHGYAEWVKVVNGGYPKVVEILGQNIHESEDER